MNKEDLIKLLTDNIDLANKAGSLNLYQKGKTYLSGCSNFFSRIREDLQRGDVPERFFSIVKNFILQVDIKQFIEDVKDGVNNTSHQRHSYSIENMEKSYEFYKKLSFPEKNIVLVGANGCGKTSLANVLTKTLNKKDGMVIPAQKILIVPEFESCPIYSKEEERFKQYQSKILNSKKTYTYKSDSDFPYQLMKEYGLEFSSVLGMLLAEQATCRDKYFNKVREFEKSGKQKYLETDKFKSVLDDVIDIWNSLIEHRTMVFNNGTLLLKSDNIEYPVFKMSDGEKVALYLIARVLLAHPQSLVVVDEPELYLHQTIVGKLWNKLEQRREDCTFVYFTHDLPFATTRAGQKYWIRSYIPTPKEDWEIMLLEENEIPESLLLTLLGSRKKVLFCEGKKDSLDRNIFEVLFPEFTIVPVEGCSEVVAYTKAFNKIPDVHAKAVGIVDRDFRTQDEISSLKANNVYSYEVAEVENLFLVENFLLKYIEYFKEDCDIEQIKKDVLAKLQSDKLSQVASWISSKINFYFKSSHLKRGKTQKEIEDNFRGFCLDVKIKEWWKERETAVGEVITNRNYEQAILIYNNKGLHQVVEHRLKIAPSCYRKKALRFLVSSDDAQKSLREYFPKELKE